MIAPNKFWVAVGGTLGLSLLVALSWGHAAPEWLHPGATVICQQETLAKTYPDPEFAFEPLAPRVQEGTVLVVAKDENWREHVGLLGPQYYVLVENRHGVNLGYVLEDLLEPTE